MTDIAVDNKLTSLLGDSASALKERWAGVWRALTFSPADELIAPRKCLAAAIEKGALSVASASKLFSKISINSGRTFSFERERFPQPNEVVSSLELSLREAGAAKSDLTLSLPKAWAIIRTAEFPSTIKENLSEALSHEMDRITPFSSEDLYYDYRILREAGNRIYLLVIAVRAETVRPYIEALNEAGFNVSRVTVNHAGMGAIFRHIYKDSDTVIVDISKDGSEGGIFIDGSLTAHFSDTFSVLPLQAERLKSYDAPEIELLANKIKALIENAQIAGQSPQMILRLKEKIPALKEILELKIGTTFKTAGETAVSAGYETTHNGLIVSGNEISYAAAGSAIHPLQKGDEAVNLLKRGFRKKEKPPVALTIILLIAAAFMWALYAIAPIGIEEKRLEVISRQIEMRQDEINKIEAMKKEAEGLSSEAAFIKGYKKDMPMTLDVLKDLTTILPKTAWLTKAKITGSSVEISGFALSATELLPKLEASEHFSKVEFTSPTIRDQGMSADRFSIRMAVSKPSGESGEKKDNEKK